MTQKSRERNNLLKSQGYTHTRAQATNAKRYIYYSLLNNGQDVLKNMRSKDGVKVYCLVLEKDITQELFSPDLLNKKESTKELLKEGYTHKKFSNNKYYNLQTSSTSAIDLADLGSIKVYCTETGQDVTKTTIATITRAKRLRNLKKTPGVVEMKNKDLREAGYTHKRYKNGKIYNLEASKYTDETDLVNTPGFKIYDCITCQDITSCYLSSTPVENNERIMAA